MPGTKQTNSFASLWHTLPRRGLLLLLLPFLVPSLLAQEVSWMEKARFAYQRDQLDTARHYYALALDQPEASRQLQGLEGLVKVALAESNMALADSLLQRGDQLLQAQPIPLADRCRFQTTRAEYFRSNAQLGQALKLHQEVIRLSQQLPDRPLIRANALYYTGLTFERMGQYDSSLFYVEQAYPLFQAQLDSTDAELSGIYNGMAVCYQRVNQLDKAKDLYLKAKAVAEVSLGPVSRNLAICLNNLSSIARYEEKYEQAIAYSEQALNIFQALEDRQGMSGAHYALGIYHFFLGDYGRAKGYLKACIALREQLFGASHYTLIGPYEVMGIIREAEGDAAQTLVYLQKARATILQTYPSGSLQEGYNYENTAICFQSLQQPDSALPYMQRAHAILNASLPAMDLSRSSHHFSYAELLYELGQFSRATRQLQQSSHILQALRLTHTADYAENLALQAQLSAAKGDWSQADTLFAQALRTVGMQARFQLEEATARLSPDVLTILHEYLRYRFHQYRATQHPQALDELEQYAQRYVQLSHSFRQQFTDPYTKSVLVNGSATVFQDLIGMYHALYAKTGKPAFLERAFAFSEHSKASLLRDLQNQTIHAYTGVPDSLLTLERQLQQQVNERYQQSQQFPDSLAVQTALIQARERLDAQLAYLQQAFPRYHAFKFDSRVPGIQEVQARLEDSQTVVEYVANDTAYYAFVISPSEAHWLYLGDRTAINTSIEQWREGMKRLDAEAVQQAGQALYRQIWQPLEPWLTAQQVLIVPVDRLFYLSLEALPATDSTYLIHHHTFSYALSLAVQFVDEPSGAAGSLLVVAPGFEDPLKARYKQEVTQALDEAYLRTVRQPWAVKLAKKLQRSFAHTAFMGERATEANIKANLHKGKVLFFGTHAIADAEDPLRSRLVLAKEVGPQTEDGYLHAYELYGLSLNAQLAVLNACESGLGRLQQGEGMISLAYSMQYAGCPASVMSLWKVDEQTSIQLTERFLRYLDDGQVASEALRQAKLDHLESADPLRVHPFYWSGLVLMGKDGKVDLPRDYREAWWWAAILLLLGSSGWLIWRRRRHRTGKEAAGINKA